MLSTSGKSPWSPNMVKLRAACNQCHAAKVRCSGERTGCWRCRNIDQACEYSVSRVGKASSNRIKSRGPQTTKAQCNSDSLEEIVLASSTRESSGTSEPKPPKRSHDVFMNWSNADAQEETFGLLDSPWDGGSSLDWQYATSATDPPFFLPPSTDFDLDSMGLNLKHGLPTPRASSDSSNFELKAPQSTAATKDQDHVQAQFPDSVEEDGSPDRPSLLDRSAIMNSKNTTSAASRSSQCMSACTKLIEYLEKRVHNNSIALDEVLRVSKVSVGEIERILNLDACRESANYLLLVSVAINQITSLFEANIRSGNVSLGTLSMVPSLVFGSFEVDPEEQIAFYTRIVGKEIRRCRQVLENLSGTLQHFSAQTAQSVGLNKHWFTSTARRLDALIAVVEEQ